MNTCSPISYAHVDMDIRHRCSSGRCPVLSGNSSGIRPVFVWSLSDHASDKRPVIRPMRPVSSGNSSDASDQGSQTLSERTVSA